KAEDLLIADLGHDVTPEAARFFRRRACADFSVVFRGEVAIVTRPRQTAEPGGEHVAKSLVLRDRPRHHDHIRLGQLVARCWAGVERLGNWLKAGWKRNREERGRLRLGQ